MRVKLFLLLILGSLFSQDESANAPSLPAAGAPASPEMVADAKDLLGSLFGAKTEQKSEDGYIINYTTISIIEYIRFASKICKVNFIYEEADLGFTITVVSDEPVTAKNVMATLVQVLRIHGLLLLEQGNSLVIHKAPDVKQIATLVTDDKTDGGMAPIVTRIFRIKNARPESIAAVVQPMISSSASLEVSSETKQLIVTDVTANVDKIAALIENLDSPHTTLEIQKYVTVHNPPEYLVRIASQIMTPIAAGNPFILVPQDLAHEIFIVSTQELAAKAIEVFSSLDSAPKERPVAARKVKPEDVFVYKILYRQGSDVLKGLSDIAENLQDTDSSDSDLIQTIESAKWIRETNSIMFVGSKSSVDKVKEFLTVLDVPGGAAPEKISFFIYKPVYKNPDDVKRAIVEMADNLKGTRGSDESLIETIRGAKVNPLTHTITFSGPEKDFSRIKELLATIDTGSAKAPPVATTPPSTQFYIYKPQFQAGDQISESLKELTSQLKSEKLADPGLMRALESMKWVKSTHSLLFTGDPDSLKKVQTLISTIDVAGPAAPAAEPKTFFQYAPKFADEKRTESYLGQVTEDLTKKGGSPSLIETLKTAKYIPESRTFMFFGSQKDLNQVQTLLTTFDVPGPEKAKPAEKTFIQYHPKYADEKKTENYLKQVTQNLARKGGSEGLIEALKSYKWIPESRSFMFYGSKAELDQVQGLLVAFDTPEMESKQPVKPGYYIYKVQNTTGDLIEEDLDNLSKNLKATGVKESPLLDVIGKMRYVKQTNSLVLSGDPEGIEEAKTLIAQYDYPRETKAAPTSTNFFMYKPLHLPARQIEKSLRELGANLKGAGLADPTLLQTIDTSKYVESTNTLVFTGTSDTLSKIQGMIKEIDVPPAVHAPIQHVGKTTFLLYKLKNAGGPQIVSSIKNMTSELKRSGTADKDFLSALASIKYVKETNSLFFTGTEESLTKVQGLVEQFDVSSLAAPKTEPVKQAAPPPISGPGTYFVYKPQSLSGPELENILQNFAENLKSSGLVDDDLYRTINAIRWSEQTQTMIITGTQKSIDQVKDLLKEFDIPSNLAVKPAVLSPLEPSIQAIDNTSFLVYKLQFHKGDEIQNALRQIAKDLMINNAPVNSGLLNSINSIQWLEVTNSLLCSGDQDTLTRLRELIKNLDIPLKQVFIEMLVIETSLANALNFGLEWGANYKYRDKFGAASYNTAGTDNFLTNFQNLTPPAPPSPFGGTIPTPPSGSGFDLGVIGEVIKHNGQTFLTLGSLLTALQSDLETSIVMTPKILTQDGRTSTIFDGRNIPFVGSFVQNNSQTTVNTSNIEYRDIGVSMTVTPVLGNSDIVTLDINLDRTQTVGDVTGSVNFNSSSAQGITTTKTSMQTTVHVPDNNFLVLSGMVNNSNAKSKVGIPCLGGLPLVGAAFSQNNESMSNSNIVIFIRPHIIHSVDEIRGITKEQEDYFRDLSGTPYLEQKFDEAMELIKTVDDD